MSDNSEVHILLKAVFQPEKKNGILFITEEQCFSGRLSCWASLAQKVSFTRAVSTPGCFSKKVPTLATGIAVFSLVTVVGGLL